MTLDVRERPPGVEPVVVEDVADGGGERGTERGPGQLVPRVRIDRMALAGDHSSRLHQSSAVIDFVATCSYIWAMKAVAVRELKNRLSAYLREVAAGEVVLVTDRGRVVAELRRPSTEGLPSPVEQALGRLVAAGVLTIGLPQDPAAYHRTGVQIARRSQALLDAERGDR